LAHEHVNKFGTKRRQEHSFHVKGILILCEIQHTYRCHNQRQLPHLSLNVVTIVSNINNTWSTETNGPTLQCYGKTFMTFSDCPPLALTDAFGLNGHW